MPTAYGGREYYRTITDKVFLLAAPRSGEVVFSFPLPLVASRANGRYIVSHAIRGVSLSYPTPHWPRKFEKYQGTYVRREIETPETFTAH